MLAVLIIAGLFYRIAATCSSSIHLRFVLDQKYLNALDLSVSFLLLFLQDERAVSVDAILRPKYAQTGSGRNLWLLRAQLVRPIFFGGLQSSTENGFSEPMRTWYGRFRLPIWTAIPKRMGG